jgi:hypothetical protein
MLELRRLRAESKQECAQFRLQVESLEKKLEEQAEQLQNVNGPYCHAFVRVFIRFDYMCSMYRWMGTLKGSQNIKGLG